MQPSVGDASVIPFDEIDFVQIAFDVIVAHHRLPRTSMHQHLMRILDEMNCNNMLCRSAAQAALNAIDYVMRQGVGNIQGIILDVRPLSSRAQMLDNPRQLLLHEMWSNLTWLERVPPVAPTTQLFLDLTSMTRLDPRTFNGHLNRFLVFLLNWMSKMEIFLLGQNTLRLREHIFRESAVDILEHNLSDAIRLINAFNRRQVIRNPALLYHYETSCTVFKSYATDILVNLTHRMNTPEWNAKLAIVDQQVLNLCVFFETIQSANGFYRRV